MLKYTITKDKNLNGLGQRNYTSTVVELFKCDIQGIWKTIEYKKF